MPGGTARLLVREPADHSASLARAEAIAGAVALARDLANTPSATKSPRWLADEAVRMAGDVRADRAHLGGGRAAGARASAGSWPWGRGRRGRRG